MNNQSSDKPTEGLRGALISGSIWMVLMRWSIRGLGFLSTIILARLLEPRDFGLVAMGMLFISLLDILTSFGAELALIQKQDATREHWDTAWSIQLVQAIIVAAGVATVAPWAADYFHEPKVTKVMRVLSFAIAIQGFANIGTVAFRKDLEFHREFRFRVSVKIGSFVLTVALALLWRDYWALVAGIIAGRSLSVILSYRLHEYRPRLTFAKIREIWSFSQWMLLRNVGMYARKQIDGFLIGHYFPARQMGLYRVSNEIAQLPTTELAFPMRAALFPGYAKLASVPRRVGMAFQKALATLATIIIPAAVGLALVSDSLVVVALSKKWSGAGPIVGWLSVFSLLLTLSTSVQAALMALDRLPRMVGTIWLQLVVSVPAVVLAARSGDVVTVAATQAITSLLLVPVFFATMTTLGVVTWRELGAALLRPTIATLAMVGALFGFRLLLPLHPIPDLAIRASLGAIVYSLVLLALWRRSGSPDGPERVILDLIGSRLRGRRSRDTAP